MTKIKNNISAIESRLQLAASDAGRALSEILLLAVSKMRTSAQIDEAVTAGINSFGENYLQETRLAAENFSWIHSVDRLKIAQRLSDQRPPSMEPLNICLQINIDNESTKSGFNHAQALRAALEIASLPGIRLRGLMAIPQSRKSLEDQRAPFRRLRELKDQINDLLDNSQKLDTLSMGMSGDMEAAILEGATIVRVGTDIFGARAVL